MSSCISFLILGFSFIWPLLVFIFKIFNFHVCDFKSFT